MPYDLSTVDIENFCVNHQRRIYTYTVVVPLFNGKTSIEKTLSSIRKNLSSRDKCIIIENCSSDGSYSFVQSLNMDNRFELIKTNIPGAGNARNIGVIKSQTDFIAFCDADDIWYDNKLEVTDYFLQQHSAQLFFHCLDTSGEKEGLAVKSKKLPRNEKLIEDLCIYGDFLPTSSVVIANVGLGDQMFLNELTHCQDYEAWCNWAQQRGENIKAVFCSTPLGYYEKENGLSKNITKREVNHISIVWHYSSELIFYKRAYSLFRNLGRVFFRALSKQSYGGLKKILTGNLQRISR